MPASDSEALAHWEELRTKDSPSALKWLFEEYYDDLYAYATRITGSGDISMDAIQNTFTDLWHYRRRLSETTSVKAYLFRSVLNHCAKIRKLNGTTVPLDNIVIQLVYSPEEPEVFTVSNVRRRRIRGLLEACSPRQREILYLRYYHNLGYREIAEVLGISYQTVINHAHDAIVKLRQFRFMKDILSGM